MVEGILTVLAIPAAIASGWLGIEASCVPVPPFTGDSYMGEGPFADALKLQVKLNARAAMCAAAAAAFQGLSRLAHLIGR
jgi:hypothetical protein